MDKIRKNDEVIILTGKDKGRRGLVKQRIDDYVIVDGINVVKKTVKPGLRESGGAGIVYKPMPIHVSNVAPFNVATGKKDRVGFKDVDGKKVRIFKSSGEVIKV